MVSRKVGAAVTVRIPQDSGRRRYSEDSAGNRRRYSDDTDKAGRSSRSSANGERSRSGQTAQNRQRARMQRPSTASQLSREFEEDDQKRRKKMVGRKKKVSLPAKIMAVVLVFAIIAGSVFLITNYGAGTQSNKKGNRYYRNGEYADAVSMYQKALSYDSHNSEYYTNLGMTYIALGHYDDALQAFDDAVKNTKRDELLQKAKRGSGIVYLYQGHYTKAQELLTEALSHGGGTYGEAEIDILYSILRRLRTDPEMRWERCSVTRRSLSIRPMLMPICSVAWLTREWEIIQRLNQIWKQPLP